MEEFINEASSSGLLGNMPSTAERNGDFSSLLTATGNANIGTDVLGRPILNQAIYDPATTRTVSGNVVRDMFPGNVIPPAGSIRWSEGCRADSSANLSEPGGQ